MTAQQPLVAKRGVKRATTFHYSISRCPARRLKAGSMPAVVPGRSDWVSVGLTPLFQRLCQVWTLFRTSPVRGQPCKTHVLLFGLRLNQCRHHILQARLRVALTKVTRKVTQKWVEKWFAYHTCVNHFLLLKQWKVTQT